jgi:hypothetical protein
MRARVKLTTDSVKETVVGILKEHHWWPHFEQASPEALTIVQEVRDSVEDGDEALFNSSDKVVLSHTPTETRGVLSLEHGVWVTRLLNPSIHLLQLACETFVAQVTEHAQRNHRRIAFVGPIQIVERKRKETIIEGQALATKADRTHYARSHRGLERRIAIGGLIVLGALVLATFPWSWRDLTSPGQTWLFSILEKLIGSIAVTSLLAWVQYRTFFGQLRDHTIRWSVPGEPDKRDIKPQAA